MQLIEPHSSRVLLNDLTRERLARRRRHRDRDELLGPHREQRLGEPQRHAGSGAEHPDLKDRVFGSGTNLLADPMRAWHPRGGHHRQHRGERPDRHQRAARFAHQRHLPRPGHEREPLRPRRGQATGPEVSDTALQEIAAATNYVTLERTNALISNNSWGYAQVFDYNSAAASYDAAVRDALPDEAGAQPMLYVFSAGNAGFGNNVGSGGLPGSIHSPGTAKNVITVGATESLRPITFEVVSTNQVTNIVEGEFVVTNVVETNQVAFEFSDSNDEIAPFSSRGNVGFGIEGDRGRFKPDLVAPGAFVASTRTDELDGGLHHHELDRVDLSRAVGRWPRSGTTTACRCRRGRSG